MGSVRWNSGNVNFALQKRREGWTLKRIARKIGTTPSSVSTVICRAKKGYEFPPGDFIEDAKSSSPMKSKEKLLADLILNSGLDDSSKVSLLKALI